MEECEYVLWLGTFPGANGKSMQGIAKQVARRLGEGKCTMDVVDPVLGNGNVTPAMKGINWVPIRVATNGAFCSGMVRWIIEHDAYNKEFVSFTNYKAAVAGGYASSGNATHLVIVDEASKNNRKLMVAADAGLEDPGEKDAKGNAIAQHVVINAETGQPELHTKCTTGVLEFDGEVNGVKVKTAFMLMKEAAFEHTIDEYAEICGVPASEIERIAKEFTSHGVKASARGLGSTVSQVGFDTTMGFRTLNALVGSVQMIGGTVSCTAPTSTGDGPRYKLATIKGKPAVSVKNARYLSRTACAWQKTDEYKNRVAAGETNPTPKLPWYPIAVGADNQALFSVVNQYPYQAKIVMSWMNNVIQNTPSGMVDGVIERLKDTSVVPLHIACDVVIGEMANLADYIVPDTNPFESFGIVTPQGHWHGKGAAVRWQAKTPGTMQLDDGRFASFEAFCCDVAKACDMPGFGDAGATDADGNAVAINDAADYFLKAVANLAYAKDPVADISNEDIKLQALDELPEAWKGAVTAEEWPKVLQLLSRGGRFWPTEARVGKEGRSALASEYVHYFYSELRGTNKNPYSGKFARGTLGWTPESFADWSAMTDHFSAEEFPFGVANYKARFRTVTMEANSPIMRDLGDKNYLELNEDDAAELGIKDGDHIRAVAATGDVMDGTAWVRAGVARHTIGVAHGYGHHAYGAQDTEIDGKKTPGNPAVAAGFNIQQTTDPTVCKDGVLYGVADNDASTPMRNGGMFRIEKA